MTGASEQIERALEQLRLGRPVLVLDDANRENEGDVVLAAQFAETEWVAWAIRYSSGFLCAPMTPEYAHRLGLSPMVRDNQDPRKTNYTVSADAASGISTGISAADRARTARVLANAQSATADLIRPGHVLPLIAKPGGVLDRPGHTEAAVDLCKLAGLNPVALIAELVHDDGQMRRAAGVHALAAQFDLVALQISDIIAYVTEQPAASTREPLIRPRATTRMAQTTIPTAFGDFTAYGYYDEVLAVEHLVLTRPGLGIPLVRVHSECLTGDVVGSRRCDCGPQWQSALAQVAEHGGALIYLRGHEGRGIGLIAKLRAYALQDAGRDTVEANTLQGLPADARDYRPAAEILQDLGLETVRLLTNNPQKITGLTEYGITVAQRVPSHVGWSGANHSYLSTKRDRMGHILPAVMEELP